MSTLSALTDTRPDWSRIALYATLLTMIVLYLSPLESGLMTSIKTQAGFQGTSPFVPPLPGQFAIEPWIEAFGRLQSGLVNSVLFAIPATILSATIGSITAYG
ncbi:MAG: carbohydrate ABC transporter permease, partial [Halohasta sp.]